MCGIAGIVNFRCKSVNHIDLLSMSKAISHRGPDDEGYVLISTQNKTLVQLHGPESNRHSSETMQDIRDFRPNDCFDIGLTHRRFSIIDLTDAGHQPFTTKDSRWSLIYNGEIYNYKELRAELEKSGVTFHSHCDTEVVLCAYQKWGTDCFNRFNGFWALAIYDPDKNTVIISRDRIGVKPLYYLHTDNFFIFASEMKAILNLKTIDINENKNAAYNWLTFGIKDHTRETFFEGIKSFPPASWAYIQSPDKFSINTFWSLPTIRKKKSEYPVNNAINDLRSILTDAISLRLRADVPLAIQLSGGIDSSSLAALARYELGIKLPAYTVRFSEPEANEEPYARLVAEPCCSDYKIIDPPSESIWGDIEEFTWLHEEPYHSPNLYSDQHIFSAMRQDGIKVTLNGAAGDEDFGGYRHHYTLMQLRRLSKIDIPGYFRSAIECKDSPNAIISLIKPIAYYVREQINKSAFKSLDIQKRLLQDMSTTLMPYWLSSGDRDYMALPIEVREPFLDYRVIEFAFTLPLEYLVNEGWQKWLLRKALDKYLPKEIVWRKRKMGYPFPMTAFLQQNKEIIAIISNSVPEGLPKYNFNNWKTISYFLWYNYFIKNNYKMFDSIRSLTKKNNWLFKPHYFSSYTNH